jgi:hypothetical protein
VYSQGATVAIGAPNIAGGNRATISYSINGSGNVAVTLVDGGSGYTTPPAITLTKPNSKITTVDAVSGNLTLTNVASVTGIVVGMRADSGQGMQTSSYVVSVGATSVTLSKTMTTSTSTLTVTFSDQGVSFASTASTLTSDKQDAIQIISFISTGSSGISGGDIIKQESSRRYLVQNAQGVGVCALTTGTLAAGQMHIIATDFGGATYWVTKLTGRKATLYPRSSTSTAYYTYGEVAPWTIGSASGTTKPTAIVSLSHTN